jgi:hypothetical protein
VYLNKIEHCSNSIVLHDFFSSRAGIDMAMQTLLVTEITQIDLQGFEFSAAYAGEIRRCKIFERVLHFITMLMAAIDAAI